MSDGWCASARATVTFCWLPPDSSLTGWPGPDDTRDSARPNGAAAAARRARSQHAEPASCLVMVIVMFSATPSSATKPSARRSSGM